VKKLEIEFKFELPSQERAGICEKCGEFHRPDEDCPEKIYGEKELADENAVKVLDPENESLDKVLEMLGRKKPNDEEA